MYDKLKPKMWWLYLLICFLCSILNGYLCSKIDGSYLYMIGFCFNYLTGLFLVNKCLKYNNK